MENVTVSTTANKHSGGESASSALSSRVVRGWSTLHRDSEGGARTCPFSTLPALQKICKINNTFSNLKWFHHSSIRNHQNHTDGLWWSMTRSHWFTSTHLLNHGWLILLRSCFVDVWTIRTALIPGLHVMIVTKLTLLIISLDTVIIMNNVEYAQYITPHLLLAD